jgi:hypothetical protein
MSERSPRLHASVIRVLDYFSVAALLLTLTIFVTGGFREWFPWGRVSMTSWVRPLVIALVAIVVRHWLQRRPSLISRVHAAFNRLRMAPSVREVWPIVLSTRACVLLVGLLAVVLFGYRPEVNPPWRVFENEFLNLPARWDTGWYIGIAAEGYRWQPARAEIQQNIAFFPAYPMLMRYAALFLGRELVWTGVLIAWVSFFWAAIYVHRFTRDRFGDERARAAIAFLACYPFALFFSTAYTEALFLLCVVGACYHFERGQLIKAGAWGLIAGLSRPNGCLLSVVLALVAVRPLWPLNREVLSSVWRPVAVRIAVASLPGIGMLLYSAYIYRLTGSPLQWAAQNAAWGRVYSGFDTLFADQTPLFDSNALYSFAAYRTIDAMQFAAVAFAFVAVWPVFRRIGLAYAVMILINIIPPLLMGGLLSMGRVTSVLFPTFVWLGAAVPERHRTPVVASFALLQALCAALFFTWRPLF